MIPPRATYRVQFRNGMTFDGAAELATYLADLGVSHLYASPVFHAAPGSTHGYDVIDFNELDPVLGGREGFERMRNSAQQHGLGLLLDFVPNHMAATPHNPWWKDVLEWGSQSAYAGHFDIDWNAPKLIVPVLAAPYGTEIGTGDITVGFDRADGGMSICCGELVLPLTPPSYAQVLGRLEGDIGDLVRRFAVATPETSSALKAELAAITADPQMAAAIDDAMAGLSADREALHELHERQVWRLAHWRAARETLTYRRFFEISDLVGVSVERGSVFDDVHDLLFELVRGGGIDGIRLDHIDGLADPRSYLERLQTELGTGDPHYVVVEKILAADEELRAEWPVAGSTGYEFIAVLAGLFVDQEREAAMSQAYSDYLGEDMDYTALVASTKRTILTRNLAGELEILKQQASELAADNPEWRDFGADTLRRAIVEIAVALPVYRTYVNVAGPAEEDRRILSAAGEAAKATREIEDEAAVDFVVRCLLLDLDEPEDQVRALDLATRFQQTTGPLMAKAVEDTIFYRYNRLVALNEVGCHPEHYGQPLLQIHGRLARRQVIQPHGLSTTATHDCKRGEDSRTRLYALSEMPETWLKAVRRWSEANSRLRDTVEERPAPEPEVEWLFYQALAGAWPADLAPDDAAGLDALAGRMRDYMCKVVREAKARTSWTDRNEAYEEAIARFTTGALDASASGAFLGDFCVACRPLFVAGALGGLSQTLIKLTAPGVPDIYQGAETWDLSLVDPDNRRPVDHAARRQMLADLANASPAALVEDWHSGAVKLHVIRQGLALRARLPALFAGGAYLPLKVRGERARHVFAFARRDGDDAAIVVVPRLVLGMIGEAPMVMADKWQDTAVLLPEALAGRSYRQMLTDAEVKAETTLRVADLLGDFPVSCLATPVA